MGLGIKSLVDLSFVLRAEDRESSHFGRFGERGQGLFVPIFS